MVGLSDQQVAWHEADVARIGTVVSVITQEEIAVLWHHKGAKVAFGGQLWQKLHGAFAARHTFPYSQNGRGATVVRRLGRGVRC